MAAKGRAVGIRLLVIFLALRAAPVCFAEEAQVVYPDEEWARWENSEDAGFTDALIQKEGVPLLINEMHTTGLVVVVGGKVLGEYGDNEELSYIASCRKSVLAMLYGNYVAAGKISLDATLDELGIGDVGGLSAIEKSATVKHLISARSGIYHPASYSGDDSDRAPPRGSQKPGSYYLYSNWDFNAAGTVFERATGMNIYDALERELAIPLQMQDFDRSRQEKEGDLTVSEHPAYPMWLSTRDMARLGYLMLRNGRWKDKQVIPAAWVREITSVVTPVDEMNFHQQEGMAYGYMWWLWPEDHPTEALRGGYTARGAYGQFITVLPALDMVVAHKTKAVYGRTTEWESYLKLLQIIAQSRDPSLGRQSPNRR